MYSLVSFNYANEQMGLWAIAWIKDKEIVSS